MDLSKYLRSMRGSDFENLYLSFTVHLFRFRSAIFSAQGKCLAVFISAYFLLTRIESQFQFRWYYITRRSVKIMIMVTDIRWEKPKGMKESGWERERERKGLTTARTQNANACRGTWVARVRRSWPPPLGRSIAYCAAPARYTPQSSFLSGLHFHSRVSHGKPSRLESSLLFNPLSQFTHNPRSCLAINRWPGFVTCSF